MAIHPPDVLRVVKSADHPLGVREILKEVGLHPGQQTDLKRVLREMVRGGELVKVGKRFEPPGGITVPRPEDGGAGRAPMGTRRKRSWEEGPSVEFDERPPPVRRGQDRTERPERPARGSRVATGRAAQGDRAAATPGRRSFGGRGVERGGDRAAPPSRVPGRGTGPRAGAAAGSGRRSGRFDEAEAPRGRGGQRGGRFDQRRAARVVSDELVEGILHVHRDGFGFVHPLKADQENIFLPAHEAARALDGDRVIVQIVEGRGGRTAGQLLEVVDRVRQRAVGVYHLEGRRAWVEPNDTSLKSNIRVPPTQLARPGDMVKVVLGVGAAVLEPGDELFGEIVGSIGQPGEPSAEVLSVAYSQGFSDEFPDEVMAEADRYRIEVTAEEAAAEGRRDLRQMPLITIDSEDARDFDDAVYAERRGDGWRLVVAIADVSHYVREGTALDAEALHRGTSVYLPDRVLPMLPERLSNGICSLRPDEDRLCMVADMEFDGRAQLRRHDLYPGVMRSAARCTYNEVQDVLDGKDVPHRNAFKPHFEELAALARALNQMRRERGAIDFDLPEYKVLLDDDGMPVKLDKRERKFSHRLVEECMLAANEAVARFFQERELPSVYRFHGEPDEEKLEAFAQLARAHGFEIGNVSDISSRDLNNFLEELEGHPERRALNHLLLRAMMQAVYSAENVGHYGLGAAHYLHFTSPIRRYPDLLVHRLLKEHWRRGGKVPPKAEREAQEEHLEALAVQSSERERAAVAVEREVVSFYQTLLMKDRVGEEFAATVASVTDFGFFVELDELHVEGLVKSESVGAGADLDPQTHALVWPDGRRVKVGEHVRVRLISANVERRQLEFDAVELGGVASDEGDEQEPSYGESAEGDESAADERGDEESFDEGERPSSPHPGFDRLRALAAQRGGGRAGRSGGYAGRGERGGGARGGAGARGAGARGGAGGRGGARGGAGRADRGTRRGAGDEVGGTGRFGSAQGGGRSTDRAGFGRERVVERDKFGNPKTPRAGGPGGRSGGRSGAGPRGGGRTRGRTGPGGKGGKGGRGRR